jgi:hypothetical protein
MTPAARILAEEILPAVAKVAKKAITGGLVKRGQRYNGALMAIGRAVNGGDFDISPAELQQPERRMAFIEQVTSATGADGACPLAWVKNQWGKSGEYNSARSAFWRVLRTLARELLDCDEPDWPSHLVWGNLCPRSATSSRSTSTTRSSALVLWWHTGSPITGPWTQSARPTWARGQRNRL